MLPSAALLFLSALPVAQESDGEAIAAHINSIFRAYIEKDREHVIATHTPDWLGFQSRSLRLVRGIEGYMVNASFGLKNGNGADHELLQIVPRVHGDIAVAPYVARYVTRRGDEENTFLYRALDIYRRDGGVWNQCGTNICVMSDDPPAYPSAADFDAFPRLRPIAARSVPEPSAEARASWKARRASAADEKRLREATIRSLASAGDVAALGELRAEDWVGFDLGSTSVLIRDGDVAPAGDPWTARVAKVELIEFESQVYGDVALVFALLRATDAAGESFLVRTAEVYRRSSDDAATWRQWASHPNPIPNVLQ